jgi:hypothetical protein
VAGLLILPLLAAVPFAFVAIRHRDHKWYRPVWWLFLVGTVACSVGLSLLRTHAAASADPAVSHVLAPLTLTLQVPVVVYFIFLLRCFPRRGGAAVDVATLSAPAAA